MRKYSVVYNKVSLSSVYNENIFFLQNKSFLTKKWSKGFNKKRKEGFSTGLATVIKKDPITTSIRKHAKELKAHLKTEAINGDLSPDLNLLDYAIWSILENKMGVSSWCNG